MKSPLPLLLGLAALVAYLFTAGPTFYWLDSSELVAASWGLGVAHPPGHPLAALIGWLFCLLPVGTLSFRVTLASAVQAAGAVTLMAALCSRLLLRLPLARSCPPWVCGAAVSAAALALGFSYALWFQAVRAEVYALNLILVVGAVHLVLRWDESGDRRPLLAAALLGGIALCNHHFLVFLCIPAVVVFLLLRRPAAGVGRLVFGLIGAGLLGMCTMLYLPARAGQLPVVNWGSATSLDRLGWLVSAQAFHKALDKASDESASHQGMGGGFAVFQGLTWGSLVGVFIALAALAGLYLLLRGRETWRPGLLLGSLVAMNLLTPMFVGLDPFNPDAYGYISVAVAFLCPGLAVLMVVVGASLIRAWRPAGVALVLLGAAVPVTQLAINLKPCDLRRHWAAEETARQILASAPPGALVVSSYFETIFNLWAVRVTSDLRPDLSVIHRNFLQYPGYVEDLSRRFPSISPLLKRWKASGHLIPADLTALARRRSVWVEPDVNLHAPVIPHAGPGGLLLSIGGSTGPRARDLHRRRIAAWTRAVGPVDERETRRAMTWSHFNLARFACQRGLTSLVRFHLVQALKLAPRDRRLEDLAHRCVPPLRPR